MTRREPEVSGPTFERHPSDVIHLVAALALLLIALALTTFGGATLVGFETDMLDAASAAPTAFTRLVVEVVQVLAIVVPAVGIGLLLVLRKYRALLTGSIAAGAGALLLRLTLIGLDRDVPHRLGPWLRQAGFVTGYAFPNVQYLAGATAALTVLTPWMNRAWQRFTWSIYALAVVLRLATGTAASGDLFLAMALGWAVGSAVSLAFGAPTRRPRATDIEQALTRGGLAVVGLRALDPVPAPGDRWEARLADGRHAYVKVFGADDRGTDLVFRAYRWLRTREPGDDRPFASLRRAVEHEALLALAAQDAGVAVPTLLTFATVGESQHAFLVAYERVPGTRLHARAEPPVSDELLRGVWTQVAHLREHRIAHRRLGIENVLASEDDHVWLIDFAYGELAASDAMLATDVAQLLAATTVEVGPERAVAAAAGVLGPEVLGEVLPRLQSAALDSRTRKVMRHRRGLLHELQAEVQRVAGVEEVHYEQLQRIRPQTVFMVVALGAAIYFLYPQLADLNTTVARIREASIGWVLVGLVLTGVTFVGAAVSLMGSVPGRLGFGPTLEAQVASAFASRVTPASAGGYALNVRFLQHQGIDAPVAVTGVGLNALGGVLVHVPLLVLFFVLAGKGGLDGLHTPSLDTFILIAAVFLVAGVVVAIIPATRRLVVSRGVVAVRNAASGLADVGRHPTKLLLLLGGSLVVTAAYVLALAASVQAFGGGASFVAIGAAYLTAAAVGAAAPTPGGLGGVEAALFAGLTVAGLDNVVALSSVFLFRFLTFWLPIPPGWFALRVLTRRGEL
jgi:undecaprenyl-diphosphatase